MRRVPLTQLAHARIARHLRVGNLAVDATAGNGHDTLFLAQCVAPGGSVYAFDVQAAALEQTAQRLLAAGLQERVELVHAGHQNLLQHIPRQWHGRVRAITFNLGYLPGGDKRLITAREHTIPALEQSLATLDPAGVISILVYPGHAGGAAEASAVDTWLQALPPPWQFETLASPGPVLHLVSRP
jgi:hypothetical protein